MKRLAFVAAAAALMVVMSWSISAGADTVLPRALVYGDSLTYEAGPSIVARMGAGWSTKIDAVPGRPICAIRAALEADLAVEHPQRITIQSHGNPYGDCLTDAQKVLASDAYYIRWWTDLDAMFREAVASGARVTYIVDPPMQHPADAQRETVLSIIGIYEANLTGVTVARQPAIALGAPNFKATQPCLPAETVDQGCVDGRIPIRAGDGVHFCVVYPDPVALLMGVYGPGCPSYSSGAYRWGRAIAAATRAAA